MNVLFVIHYPVFGGPHNQAFRLRNLLCDFGWEMTVLLPDEPGLAARRLAERGVEVVQMPLHRFRATLNPLVQANFALRFWPEICAIRRLLRNRQFDLVLIGGLVNPHAGIAARLERIPVVWQITDSRLPPFFRVALMTLVRKWSDTIMFNGERLVDLHGGPTNLLCPWYVYYPPVETTRFRNSVDIRRRCFQQYGIPPDGVVIGTVANLNPQKGIEYFIRAASIIYRSLPNTWFLIVGASYTSHRRYNAVIQKEVAQSGIPSDRLIFTGEQQNVENFYPAMDLKLITSVPYSEGTTTTGMEAMACGVPVVATDVGGVREIVKEGVTGCVVPPLDPQAIANTVLYLLKDGTLRKHMARWARDHAVEKFDAKLCAETHIKAFDSALAFYGKKPKRSNF